MALTIDCRQDVLLVRVNGDFDLVSAAEFRQRVDMALEEKRAKHLVMNMTKVSFMDSSGLGVILGRLKQIQARKGKMVLTDLQPSVLKVLKLSGIMPLLQTCKSDEEALALLRKEVGK